jgi:putative flippase GtrA
MLKKILQSVIDYIYPLFQRFLPYQVYAYLVVGGINTALNIFLYIICYLLLLPKEGVVFNGFVFESYTISLVIAFVITVPTGYWLAKEFAFTHSKNNDPATAKQAMKYVLVVLQGLGSDYLLLKGLIVIAGMNPTPAKIVSTITILTMNYLLQKYFTFREKPTPTQRFV